MPRLLQMSETKRSTQWSSAHENERTRSQMLKREANTNPANISNQIPDKFNKDHYYSRFLLITNLHVKNQYWDFRVNTNNSLFFCLLTI